MDNHVFISGVPDPVSNVLQECLHVGENDKRNTDNMRMELAKVVDQSPKPADTWLKLSSILDVLLRDKHEQYERAKILNEIIKERI